MTTRASEELDRGLGSCLAGFAPELRYPTQMGFESQQPAKTPRLAETSSWAQDPQQPQAAGGVDARPKKMEKEPVTRGTPGPGKEKLKSGATSAGLLPRPTANSSRAAPRSAPARKKAQAAPPAQPPPPPPALSEELPWGDVTLNKCLVLASLVALLGSAFQLCRDAVAGEQATPAPWVPPISPPKDPVSPMPKPAAGTPPSRPRTPQVGPPAPQGEAGDKPEVPRSQEAAEKVQRDPAEATSEAAGEERATLAEQGHKEKPRKEKPRRERPRKSEKPWKEKLQKEERPRKERPRREARPRAAGEPREALPRRWETREEGHRLWARNSGDPEHRKGQAWASPRRPEEGRPPGRQRHRQGKGRD
ncbi:PREDICTED: junctional sarcoplasmic reticulum protein 1 isoform X2 [Chinchilla lanigera]|uniref:junctional sarcoplasmic reticulum protein 1 isoform X2 n=1 Tax=Chinchilla lanigera TaxID=34839 RepID=UPI000699010A|nr:PREDICTED: junctional sarcoplasmic reticulum protein 1 isoform X2 [Chinchilla lanigera]